MLEVRIARSVGSLQLDVDLSVSSGTVLVAGPNGAGKTTLLHLILGISRPDAGRILLDGRPLFDCRVDVPAERRCLGYVPQDSALFPHLDVLGNVAFGLGHLPRAERRDRAGAWLTKLGVSDLARRRIAALSGGERQRVALARALAREPRALLLDEPFASLDPTARRELRVSLRGATYAHLGIYLEAAYQLGNHVGAQDHQEQHQGDGQQISQPGMLELPILHPTASALLFFFKPGA